MTEPEHVEQPEQVDEATAAEVDVDDTDLDNPTVTEGSDGILVTEEEEDMPAQWRDDDKGDGDA